jgi:hypothetical protein
MHRTGGNRLFIEALWLVIEALGCAGSLFIEALWLFVEALARISHRSAVALRRSAGSLFIEALWLFVETPVCRVSCLPLDQALVASCAELHPSTTADFLNVRMAVSLPCADSDQPRSAAFCVPLSGIE